VRRHVYYVVKDLFLAAGISRQHPIRKRLTIGRDLHAQAALNNSGGACAQPRPFAIAGTSVTKAIRILSCSWEVERIAAQFLFVFGFSPRLRASAVRF
jgi:hypothetical protein